MPGLGVEPLGYMQRLRLVRSASRLKTAGELKIALTGTSASDSRIIIARDDRFQNRQTWPYPPATK